MRGCLNRWAWKAPTSAAISTSVRSPTSSISGSSDGRHVTVRATWRGWHIGRRWQAAACLLLKPLRIVPDGIDVGQSVTDRVANGRDDRTRRRHEPVMNPESLAARLDQASLAEVCEVARNLRLWNPQRLLDVAHAELTGQQQSEDAKSCGIGQGLEQPVHVVQRACHLYLPNHI